MFVCVCVARALGKDALGLYSIGTEGLGLGISSRYSSTKYFFPSCATNKRTFCYHHMLSLPKHRHTCLGQR